MFSVVKTQPEWLFIKQLFKVVCMVLLRGTIFLILVSNNKTLQSLHFIILNDNQSVLCIVRYFKDS